MKISAYYKSKGSDVELKTDYSCLDQYDKVFISKVFTDTPIDDEVLKMQNVEYGGTGFFYDKAPPLSEEIEHQMPDYHLYDSWVEQQISNGINPQKLKYYTDYSIGFLTRGCFRQCNFCVNRNCKKAVTHSPVLEFMDETRPKLCFLDDNFFACTHWHEIIDEVKKTGKKFQFKQGLDERLLTDDKIHELISWYYDGDYIFAFDNIQDRELIESKLKRIFELYPNFRKRMKFYVLCGFDRNGVYDDSFWRQDIADTFERIFILAKYSALPYIMRYEKSYHCRYKGTYTNLASWCNQPSIFKKFSYEMYCKCRGMSNKNYAKYGRNVEQYLLDGGKKGSSWRYYEELLEEKSSIEKYVHIVPDHILEYGNGRKVL